MGINCFWLNKGHQLKVLMILDKKSVVVMRQVRNLDESKVPLQISLMLFDFMHLCYTF